MFHIFLFPTTKLAHFTINSIENNTLSLVVGIDNIRLLDLV